MRGLISGFWLLVLGTLVAAWAVLQLGQMVLPPIGGFELSAVLVPLGLVCGLWAGKVQRDRRQATPQATAVIIPFTPRPR